MSHESIPDNASEHHTRLAELGVVDRVTRILTARDMTHSISNPLCWAAMDRGQLVVKVAYRHQRAGLNGQKTGQPMEDRASFAVAANRPFGPMGSQPLPAASIAAIRDLARA